MRLAYTKIRTRRIRLFVVLVVASLLFSGLVAGSLIITGSLDSFRKFSDEGFSNRFILAGRYVDSAESSGVVTYDPALIAQVESREKKQIAEKEAEARRLGIPYSKDDEQSAVFKEDNGEKTLDESSPLVYDLLIAEQEERDVEKQFKDQVSGAESYYRSLRMPMQAVDIPTLSTIKNGQEDKSSSRFDFSSETGIGGVTKGWMLMDAPLLEPFLLPGQTLDYKQGESVPIVASYSAAQEVLKLPKLGKNATNEDRIKRLEEVRSSIAGRTFEICYRNTSSSEAHLEAIQQQADIEKNRNKDGFEMPSLVYKQNAQPCAQPVVDRDTRLELEKELDEKTRQFDKKFGKRDAESQIITFRIVGISQDMNMSSGSDVSDIATMLLASSNGATWASPIGVYDELAVAKDVFKPEKYWFDPQQIFYAEYASASEARNTYKQKNCVNAFEGMPLDEGDVACSKDGRSFELMPFGSISLALDDFQQGFRKVQLISAAIIAGIASIILMGMIGRIIADSRKETAVFRAVGASRIAIAQIYLTYTVYLAVLTTLTSLGLGLIAAVWVQSMFASEIGIQLALVFNVADLTMPFRMYGISLYDFGLIASVILGASLVGAAIPIATNVRRNPIRDMREE